MKEKLYAVAIFALKPDPEHTVMQNPDGSFKTSFQSMPGDVEYNMTPGVGVSYNFAASLEEAKEAGLVEAERMYPESEGYLLHYANAVEISAEAIMGAAASLHDDFQPAPDETDWPM